MGLQSIVKVIISGEARGAKEAFEQVRGESEKTESKLGKFSKIAAASFVTVGVAAAAFAVDAIKGGDQLNESQDQLKNTIANLHESYTKLAPAIAAADKAGEKYGYSSIETNEALKTGAIATGSMSKSLGLLQTAQNLAAATGKPLGEAMTAVAKASEGNLRPLKQLGIDLPIAASGALKLKNAQLSLHTAMITYNQVLERIHTGHLKGTAATMAMQKANNALKVAQSHYNDVANSSTTIMDALNKRLKGTADVGAESLAGKVKALKAKFEDWKDQLGQKMIPMVLKLADFITKTLIPAIGQIVTWVQANWPKVRDAIVPVLDQISKYIAGFVATVTHLWDQFGGRIVSFAMKYFNALKETISGALEVIKGVFRLFADLLTGKWSKLWGDIITIFGGLWKMVKGALATAWAEITSLVSLAWAGIKNATSGAVSAVIGFVVSIPGKLAGFAANFLWQAAALGTNIVSGIMSFELGLPGKIIGVFAGAVSWLYQAGVDLIKGLVNGVASMAGQLGGAIKGVFDSIPGVSLLKNIPGLSWLASGGPAKAGMPYIVGEDGPELFMPDQSGVVIPNGASTSRGGAPQMGSGGSTHITINMPAGIDPAAVVREQDRYNRRNGRTAA